MELCTGGSGSVLGWLCGGAGVGEVHSCCTMARLTEVASKMRHSIGWDVRGKRRMGLSHATMCTRMDVWGAALQGTLMHGSVVRFIAW